MKEHELIDTAYRELTPEEQSECDRARFIVRAIGFEGVHAFTNSIERAFGHALRMAQTQMLPEGTWVEDRQMDYATLEFRIDKDRETTIVSWIRKDRPSTTQEPQIS